MEPFFRNVTVLYDRPPAQFHPVDLVAKHDLFMKLSKEHPRFMPKCYNDLKESGVLESTALTQKLSNGLVHYKSPRMAILVSSTSWTPDEDFSLLLKALQGKLIFRYLMLVSKRRSPTFFLLYSLRKRGQQSTQQVSILIVHYHWQGTTKRGISETNRKTKLHQGWYYNALAGN